MSGDEEQEKKKRIDLSVSQLAGGGVATLTAATAASYLGVYGTIAGAAIMSVMSTAGTAVVQHYLKQSGEKARVLTERAKRTHTAVAVEAVEVVETAVPKRTGSDDVLRTRAMPTVGSTAVDGALPARSAGVVPDADDPATELLAPVGPDGTAEPGSTQALPSVGEGNGDGAHGPFADAATAADPADERSWWQRYRALIIPAVVVFALVMLVILVFELFTGRNLADTVRGNDTHSGPSLLGGGGQPAQDVPSPAPTAPSGGTGQEGDTGTGTVPSPGTGQDGGGQPGGDAETSQPVQPTDPPEQPDQGGDGTGEDGSDGGTGTDPNREETDQQPAQPDSGADPGLQQAPVE